MKSMIVLTLLFATLVLSSTEGKNGGYSNQKGYGDYEYYGGESDYEDFTCEQYTKAYNLIDHDFISNPTYSSFAIQALVRLAFHDCVGKSCDGCLNSNDVNNAGLVNLAFKTALDDAYDKNLKDDLSRADFYSLAGHVALVRGAFNTKCKSDDCESLLLNYNWGRKDCPTSPNTDTIDGFPDAHGDFSEVVRVLRDNFRLENPYELVALMGCHSLGGAHSQFSGWNFTWQVDETVFDNTYFKNLIADGLNHVNVGNRSYSEQRWQFIRPVKHQEYPVMMLNTDMSIWKTVVAQIKNDDFTGQLACVSQKGSFPLENGEPNFVENCEDAPTAPIVVEYANDLGLFYYWFTPAWNSMVSTGYPLSGEGVLKSPNGNCGSCVPEGAYCAPGYTLSQACCEGLSCEHNVCQ